MCERERIGLHHAPIKRQFENVKCEPVPVVEIVTKEKRKNIYKKERKETCSLADIELERLESTANGGASGAFPTGALLGHENLDAGRAETADTFSARIGILQKREALARGAVDLDGLRRICGRRTG